MLECIWPPAELYNPIILLHTYPSSQRNQSFSDKHCGFRIKLAHPLTNPVLDWRRRRNSQTRLSEQSKLRLKINFSWNCTLTFITFLCIVVFYVDSCSVMWGFSSTSSLDVRFKLFKTNKSVCPYFALKMLSGQKVTSFQKSTYSILCLWQYNGPVTIS